MLSSVLANFRTCVFNELQRLKHYRTLSVVELHVPGNSFETAKIAHVLVGPDEVCSLRRNGDTNKSVCLQHLTINSIQFGNVLQ